MPRCSLRWKPYCRSGYAYNTAVSRLRDFTTVRTPLLRTMIRTLKPYSGMVPPAALWSRR